MSDIEQLDELVYLLPVGGVSFIEDGTIEMANPLSVQLRNPLVPPAAMGNAFTCRAPLVPGLALRLTASGDAPLVVARRRSALQVFGQARVTVELSIHRTRPGHFVAILADVTSLTRQEQAVRRERDRIRLIVEMVHAYAIYPTDRDGVINSWNTTGTRLFGLAPDAALGRSLVGNRRRHTAVRRHHDLDAGRRRRSARVVRGHHAQRHRNPAT